MFKMLKENYKVDINDYQKIKELNQGGFGIIYLVKDKKTEQLYVAKVTKDSSYQKTRNMNFINREIGILMRVHHPTIIALKGFSFQDFKGSDNITLIMEYMKQGSVASLIDNEVRSQCPHTYNNTKRQIILAGVARGMMILHEMNVIHRDLSAGNILLDDDFHPYITDFGLSKFFDPTHSMTQSLFDVGTSIYMAPEVIIGDNFNTKADVYAFGIIMFEIITGTRAYAKILETMNTFTFKQQIVNGLRPTTSAFIPPGFKELIDQCLLQEPDRRPTFKEIFNKLSLSYSNELLSDEDELKYCLENVDLDEFLEYIEIITQSENECLTRKIDEMRLAYDNEIGLLRNTIKSQQSEIDSLHKKIASANSGDVGGQASSSIGNFFYAAPSLDGLGMLGTLKSREKNKFDRLFIASQSNRDVYDLINPNSTTFFGSYSRNTKFYIDFTFANKIRLNGMKIYSCKSHFIRSFQILIDGTIVKTVENAEELNGPKTSMTVEFPETTGTVVRFLQTGKNWSDSNCIFIRRIELLSPDSTYSEGVFRTMINENIYHDPHKCNVLVKPKSFGLDSIHKVNSSDNTFIENINSYLQIELIHGSAILTGFRIKKNPGLKTWKIIASDDINKPDEEWIKLYEHEELSKPASTTCNTYTFDHPSPLVRFVRLVLAGPDWYGSINLNIHHFDIFGYYFQ